MFIIVPTPLLVLGILLVIGSQTRPRATLISVVIYLSPNTPARVGSLACEWLTNKTSSYFYFSSIYVYMQLLLLVPPWLRYKDCVSQKLCYTPINPLLIDGLGPKQQLCSVTQWVPSLVYNILSNKTSSS